MNEYESNKHTLCILHLPIILNIIMIYNILNTLREYNECNNSGILTINDIDDIRLIPNLEQIYCPICLEYESDNNKSMKLSCNHYFHRNCIVDWINYCNLNNLNLCKEINVTCPICRTLITY